MEEINFNAINFCPSCKSLINHSHLVQCEYCQSILNFIPILSDEEAMVFYTDKCPQCNHEIKRNEDNGNGLLRESYV